ncbi:MAG: CPBP family intramembrane metalloprotease [Ruminococcus sp.]|nr:CPBP family intramembrane metalloprotease [Ruminococcus sp.]
MIKKSSSASIGLVVLIALANFVWGSVWIFHWKNTGELRSLNTASSDITHIFTQHLTVSAISIAVFLISIITLRSSFVKKMRMSVKGKRQCILMFVCLAVWVVISIYAMLTKHDKLTVGYSLFYYLIFIAFFEEFIFRDVLPELIRNERTILRYLLPNILFGAVHIFSYAGWGTISFSFVLRFLISQMWYYIGFGCLMQLIKEKSGTIWIPVLIHAVWDSLYILK